jgi:hypothetical protein
VRSTARLTVHHLGRLSALAAADRELFYAAQPYYRDRHVATVLAQGAALHFLDGSSGVKDLDVWSFFAIPTRHARFPADVRQRHVDFGPSDLGRQLYTPDLAESESARRRWQCYADTFSGRRVDLMMRGLRCRVDDDPGDAIRRWLGLGRRPTDGSPWYLAQKGVILIDPAERRGEIVWDPR